MSTGRHALTLPVPHPIAPAQDLSTIFEDSSMSIYDSIMDSSSELDSATVQEMLQGFSNDPESELLRGLFSQNSNFQAASHATPPPSPQPRNSSIACYTSPSSQPRNKRPRYSTSPEPYSAPPEHEVVPGVSDSDADEDMRDLLCLLGSGDRVSGASQEQISHSLIQCYSCQNFVCMYNPMCIQKGRTTHNTGKARGF
ncbi:hypothetical protein C8J56DRAFT_1048902 [Mycena floridula]|nr:hypothetical protein C8J56DRAFT_1048902 [Mycena floridula]